MESFLNGMRCEVLDRFGVEGCMSYTALDTKIGKD
jgi:hypothetical protein